MRTIPIYCLKDGMKVGRTVRDADGRVLLKEGMRFKEVYIKKLEYWGISSVHISDELTNGVEPVEAIARELREKTVRATQKFFITLANNDIKAKKEDVLANEMARMVQEIVEDILKNKDLVVNGVDIKRFDSYTFEHSVNVAVLSLLIGVDLGYDKWKLRDLGMASLFHDIGKVFIPGKIINKRGRLTEDEFSVVMGHSEKGGSYVKYIMNLPRAVYRGVYEHHEKYDGTGYPKGKKGENISEFGRIIAVADVFDALTSQRPYRKPMQASDAFEYIMSQVGTHFDIRMVEGFKRKIAMYPVGTVVRLSTGDEGVVVENFVGFGNRPKVRIFSTGDELDLANDFSTMSVLIDEVLDEEDEVEDAV